MSTGALRDQTAVNIRERAGRRKASERRVTGRDRVYDIVSDDEQFLFVPI